MFEVWQLILIAVIFSTASLIHGLCGFGFSLLSVGIMSFFLDPGIAVPLDLVVASANCLYLAWLLRKSIKIRQCMLLIILSTAFIPLGALYLRKLNPSIVIRSLGVVIIIFSSAAVLKKKRLKLFSSRFSECFAGISSGLLGGAFNVPGPPLILYSCNCSWSLREAIANLQLIFSVMTVTAFISYIWLGLLTRVVVFTGLGYIPLVVVFTFIGSYISKKVPVNKLKILINFALIVLGSVLLARG